MKGFLLPSCICIGIGAFFIFLDMKEQNDLIEMRLKIPQKEEAVKRLEEKNALLNLEVEAFQSPSHLIELAQKPEFGHLRYPNQKEILFVPKNAYSHIQAKQGSALQGEKRPSPP